jgi:proteasome lid subunit RPN8/RPN11
MSEEFERTSIGNKIKKNDSELEQEKREPTEEIHKEKISKPVVLRAEVYKTIILYASRYANKAIPPKDWKEIYGILIGHSDDDFVYIERAEALTFGHSTDVQLDQRHYVFIAEIQDKLDNEGKGHYVIGWFHSHPGLGLFFSYIDLRNQLFFQGNNADGCGLVFDHTLLGKKKEEKIEGTEHTITKYDTGFEIYRLTDVNMDINAPDYENNYHKVEYFIEGLNKFFFANVLSELSALVSARKPLQSAYGEHYELESSYTMETDEIKDNDELKTDNFKSKINFDKNSLVQIPISDDITFDVDDLFYNDMKDKKSKKVSDLREIAEKLIYEGNQAFKEKNAFMGVEKYNQGIKKYRKLNDYDRVLELLRNLSEHCISTNHQKLAQEFVEELYNIALQHENLFYKAEANYLTGYLILKKNDNELLEYALKKIQEASIDYEKAEDFAGAGKCYYKIGAIYQSRLNHNFNACLFYVEAIKNHNKAILRGHSLRKSLWSKPESLSKRIIELKDIVEELIIKIENLEEKEKIKKDINSIQMNI